MNSFLKNEKINENIEEIINYNGNDEFNQYNQELNQSTEFTRIYIGYKEYSKKETKIVDKSNNIYVQLFHIGELVYEGFFSQNKYNGKGTLYNNGKKVYEGFFKDNKYNGIGIEYFPNKSRKRKAKYENGKISKKCYGILYNDKNEQEYAGLLLEGIPKEGKSIKYYGENNYIIYIGDFYDYKYNGNGILYFKNGDKQYEGNFVNNLYEGKGALFYNKGNKIFYTGIFKKGLFNYGILYDPSQNKNN